MNVSVIVTNFNKGNLLLEALESLITQINSNDEVIIVDDCSTDTKSIHSFLNAQIKYSKFLFFTTPKNNGSSYAKNFGINKSKNEIIVLLDADDTLPSGSLKAIKNQFKSHPSSDLVFGNYTFRDMDKNIQFLVDCSVISTNNVLDKGKLARNWILLGTSPFKKSVYFRIGGFDNLYPKTDDIDFQRKLVVNNFQCTYINKSIYNWNRYNNGNNSGHTKEDTLLSIMRSFEFYYRYLNIFTFIIFLIKRCVISVLLKARVWK